MHAFTKRESSITNYQHWESFSEINRIVDLSVLVLLSGLKKSRMHKPKTYNIILFLCLYVWDVSECDAIKACTYIIMHWIDKSINGVIWLIKRANSFDHQSGANYCFKYYWELSLLKKGLRCTYCWVINYPEYALLQKGSK